MIGDKDIESWLLREFFQPNWKTYSRRRIEMLRSIIHSIYEENKRIKTKAHGRRRRWITRKKEENDQQKKIQVMFALLYIII